MTTIWWVRHGPTHAKAMVGWTDVPADLSDQAAVARLREYLPAGVPVLSSDLSRTRATADAIAGARPRLPVERDLREIHFGNWEGKRVDEVTGAEATRLRRFWDAPGEDPAPGGESWNTLLDRVDRAEARLTEAHDDLIIVAHLGVIVSRLQRALGISPYDAFGHAIAPLSVTCIRWDGDAATVNPINHTP